MRKKQKLELTWIGKDKRPRLEPRILLEDKALSYRAKEKDLRGSEADLRGFENLVGLLISDEEVADIVYAVTEKLIELTLDVPKIVVLPTREVNYGFHDFDLQGLELISFQPVSQEILLQHLDNNQKTSIHWAGQDAHEEQLDNYLVRYLWDKDEIDYDEHAGLLYKLTGQLMPICDHI